MATIIDAVEGKQSTEHKLLYGDSTLTPEEYASVPDMMMDSNQTWTSLNDYQRKELGGYQRFSASLLETANSRGLNSEEKDQMLYGFGLPQVQAATQPSRRWMNGLASTIANAGNALGLTEENTAESMFMQKEITTRLYKAYEGTSYDMITGLGEATSAIATGIVAAPALAYDLAAQTVLSGLEYAGSKDFDDDAINQVMVEGAANLFSFGLGKYLVRATGKPLEEVQVISHEADALAKKLGIKLFDVDTIEGVSQMRTAIKDKNLISQYNLSQSTVASIDSLLSYVEKAVPKVRGTETILDANYIKSGELTRINTKRAAKIADANLALSAAQKGDWETAILHSPDIANVEDLSKWHSSVIAGNKKLKDISVKDMSLSAQAMTRQARMVDIYESSITNGRVDLNKLSSNIDSYVASNKGLEEFGSDGWYQLNAVSTLAKYLQRRSDIIPNPISASEIPKILASPYTSLVWRMLKPNYLKQLSTDAAVPQSIKSIVDGELDRYGSTTLGKSAVPATAGEGVIPAVKPNNDLPGIYTPPEPQMNQGYKGGM